MSNKMLVVRIALNNNPGVQPIKEDDRDTLARLMLAMPDRDADVTLLAFQYAGVIEKWSIERNRDNDRQELVLEIKLQTDD